MQRLAWYIGRTRRCRDIGRDARIQDPDDLRLRRRQMSDAQQFHALHRSRLTLMPFLDRAGDVLPETTGERVRESSSFLDEFVLRVYLPLLEERVAFLFLKIVNSRPILISPDFTLSNRMQVLMPFSLMPDGSVYLLAH